MPLWITAFVAALALTGLGGLLLGRFADAGADRPRAAPRVVGRVPPLGAVLVMAGVVPALLLQTRLSVRVGLVAGIALALGLLGLLDDDRRLPPRFLVLATATAATIAAAVGLRLSVTGVPLVDAVLTVALVVAVTCAMTFLDLGDGAVAGMAALVASGVFALAVVARQPVLATLGAAVGGACLGLVVSGRGSRSVALGGAGNLFVGFTLAVLAIDVSRTASPAFSFVTASTLLGLLVLDITVVFAGRLRRDLPLSLAGGDHLFHRLVARGVSGGGAAAVLVAVQAALSLLAVLGGRRVVPLTWAIAGSVVLLGATAVATAGAPVHSAPVAGLTRRLRLGLWGAVLAMPVLAIPAVLALAQAARPARAGAAAAEQAVSALGSGDAEASAAAFERAGKSFAEADRHLRGPLVSVGLAVPVLSSNLHASRTLVSIGRRLSSTGTRLSAISDGSTVKVQDGAVSLDEVRRLTPTLERAARDVRRSSREVADIDRSFLIPPIHRAMGDLETRLAKETVTTDRAAESARLLPGLLGGEGPRRYFLAFQNNAEIRGTGGFIGNWGELVGEGGRLRLERFGRIDDLNDVNDRRRVLHMPQEFFDRWWRFQPAFNWQQTNISPDFPTTSRVIMDLYPQSGGGPLDGVIAIDPLGLAALLELAGPVPVPSWPEPVTAANVVDITLRAAYERFPVQAERVDFLGDLSRRVAQAFTTGNLGTPPQLARVLSKAARGGHLLVHLAQREEQGLITRLGVDGALPPVTGDSVMVVNQNAVGHKVDYFLRRKLRYEVDLDPDRRPAMLTARVEVGLQNDAPSSGLPVGVIGPAESYFTAGENRTYVSVYSPLGVQRATLDDRPLEVESAPDLGRQAYSSLVSIPSMESRTVSLDLSGRARLSPDGWYRFDVLHQPTLVPDEVEVSVAVPPGWRIVEARGAEPAGERRAEARLQVESAHTVWVRLERTSGWARAWDRLLGR